MKGHLPARYHNVRRQILPEEITLNIPDRGNSSWSGRPSYVFDDQFAEQVWPGVVQRLEHVDRATLREKTGSWPARTVVLEGTVG